MYHCITLNVTLGHHRIHSFDTAEQATAFLYMPPRQHVIPLGYYHQDPDTSITTIQPNPQQQNLPQHELNKRIQRIAAIIISQDTHIPESDASD